MRDRGNKEIEGHRWDRLVPLTWRGDILLGIIVLVITAYGAWHVSPWVDEAATANITSYSTWDMIQLWMGNVGNPRGTDLAQAPYYLLIHQWVRLVGTSPFSLRFPSMIAAAIGTTAMAAAGRNLIGRRGQITYAFAYGLLPRTTAMAIEARPYQMSSMCVAVTILVLVKIYRHPRWWHWAFLVFTMLGAMAMQIYAALPIAGIIITAFIVFNGTRRWLTPCAGLLSVELLLPFALASFRQVGQTSAAAGEQSTLVDRLLVESWATTRVADLPTMFSSDVIPHYIASATAIIAGAVVVVAIFNSRGKDILRLIIAASIVAFVVAFAALIVISGVASMWARYLSPLAPLFAILFAEAILLIHWQWARPLIGLLAAGCLIIISTQQFSVVKADDTDYSLMYTVMRQKAVPGDGYLFDPSNTWIGPYNNAVQLDPDAFKQLVNIALPEDSELTTPWSPDAPHINLEDMTCLPSTIWVASSNIRASDYGTQLESFGYTADFSQRGTDIGHTVTRWIR